MLRALRSRSHVSIGVRFPASVCVRPAYQSSARRAISVADAPDGSAALAPLCSSSSNRRSASTVRFFMDGPTLAAIAGGCQRCRIRTCQEPTELFAGQVDTKQVLHPHRLEKPGGRRPALDKIRNSKPRIPSPQRERRRHVHALKSPCPQFFATAIALTATGPTIPQLPVEPPHRLRDRVNVHREDGSIALKLKPATHISAAWAALRRYTGIASGPQSWTSSGRRRQGFAALAGTSSASGANPETSPRRAAGRAALHAALAPGV